MWPLSRAPIPIRVTTVDTELEFQLRDNATGKELFEQVVKTIGLRETWYFGLQYRDSKGYLAWLKYNEKVMSQDVVKAKYDHANRLQFILAVKFYPEDVPEEVIQEITLRHFYLQILQQIYTDKIYCSPETSVVLAGYALQEQLGDYSPELAIRVEKLLPARVILQHQITSDEWANRIVAWWRTLGGMSNEDAMRDYLKLAQDLEMYGVNYFEVTNKKGTELYLGIDAHGINVYERRDKLTPKTGFPWSEIRTIAYDTKKFIIKPTDKRSKPFVCYATRFRFAKQMLMLASGNHEFYLSRRKPDSIEVLQMKAQAQEEKANKQKERERLLEEIEARKQAQKAHHDLEAQLKSLAEEMQRRQRTLIEAHEKIEALEGQLQSVRAAKECIEQQQSELEQLNKQLAESNRLESSERTRLEQEIAAKQREFERAQAELAEKNEQTKRLQEEVDEAKRTQQMEVPILSKDIEDEGHHDEEQPPIPQPKQTEIHLNDGGDYHVELMRRTEEDRETQVSKKKDLKQHLKELSADLAKNVVHSKVTENDELHRANVKAGRDKYKTLKDIRKGNTMRRVDYFENM